MVILKTTVPVPVLPVYLATKCVLISMRGFPLVTTKKIHLKSVIYELLWFLKGDTNIGYLNEHGVRIWNEWANEDGDLGPIMATNGGLGQTTRGGTSIKYSKSSSSSSTIPTSRRIIVSAWNVAQLEEMALAPCHCFMQFYVADGKLQPTALPA